MNAVTVLHILLETEAEQELNYYLSGLTSLYHYYDVHVDFGGDDGYSVFVKTTIAAPPDALSVRAGGVATVHDVVFRQRIIAEAVRQDLMPADDVSAVDYVAVITAEEWESAGK